MNTRRIVFVLLVAAILVPGCAPTVSGEHLLPAAAPMPEGGIWSIQPGELTVSGVDIDPAWQAAMQAVLADRAVLRDLPAAGPARAELGLLPAQINADATLEVQETADDRRVVRQDAMDVPSLVREVRLEVVFYIGPPDGEEFFGVESHQDYDSRSDPRVRGELGLGRPDDPDRVPPVAQIAGELLSRAIDDLKGQLTPVRIPYEIEMRPVGGPHGKAGLDMARDGRWLDAVGQFEALVEAEPSSADARLDLAVAREMAGRYAAALDAYRTAQQLAGETLDLRQHIRRVRRVLRAYESVEPLVADNVHTQPSDEQ